MSTIRRTLPLFKSICKTSSLKSFHTTTRALAAAKPKPKPQRRRVPTTTADKSARSSSSTEDYLPPTVLLSSAHKAGALDIEPEKALNLLRDYCNKAAMSSGGFEENICAEYGIKPATLVMLGQILRRCQGTAQRVLAKRLMISASALGDPVATFGLIESAIRTKSLDAQEDLLGPLKRLGILAKQDRNPEAMALLGKVLLTQGKETEALEWLQKATSHSPDATPAIALNFEGASAALVSLGRLYLNRSDKVAAEEAFRKAAVDLDDPAAYFYLSQLRESGSPEQEVYLLKAASSGIAEAFHNLGALELAKLNVKFDESAPKSISDYGMAREWFQVAAADGFGLSMVNMASICKAVGQDDVALRWLDKAEALPDMKKHAKEMRKTWAIQKTLGK